MTMPFSRHVLATMLLSLGSLTSNLAWGQWHLPLQLGSGPALFTETPPPGYQLASSQSCAQQVLDFDPYCLETGWDLLCQQNYECCMQEEEQLFLGCMNPVACNYDPMACVDVPTSCLFCLESCVSVFVMGDAFTQWTLEDGDNVVASGEFDSGNPSGLQAACVNDGCYTLTIDSEGFGNPISWRVLGAQSGPLMGEGNASLLLSFGEEGYALIPGCTDPEACNFNDEANDDDASCTFPGCIHPLACNYNPEAGCDDGSCLMPPGWVPGCTNVLSSNYNPAATADDGSCSLDYMCLEGTVYDPELMGCVPATCPGDFNLDGMVALEDLLSFLQVYSTPCSD